MSNDILDENGYHLGNADDLDQDSKAQDKPVEGLDKDGFWTGTPEKKETPKEEAPKESSDKKESKKK